MAGYIMTIGEEGNDERFYKKKTYKNKKVTKEMAKELAKEYVLERCISRGVYASHTSGKGSAFIGVLADYLGMKPGDDIYFFMERKIYGIGKLVDIAGLDCRFRIHPKANMGTKKLLIRESNPIVYQFVCTFEPAPYFFTTGVDMDEVLSFCPEKIRALRFFSNMTFMKLDDIESEAIKSLIVRKNEDYLSDKDIKHHFKFSNKTHEAMEKTLQKNPNAYTLSVFDFIKRSKKGKLSSEYYLEGAIMDLLRQESDSVLGRWDFVSRQYPASPAKPSIYKETMDLFGYRYVPEFPTVISKYLVIELKKGIINKEHIQQTMKYVDWISQEYTNGDYSMIEAHTIGFDQEADLTEDIDDLVERNYIIEGHPIESKKWNNLRILEYRTLLNELQTLEEDLEN